MRHDYPSDPVWSVKDGACGAVFGTRKKPFRRAPIRCAIVLPYHSAYGTAHESTTACAQRLVPVGYESASSFDHYEKRKNQTNPSPWPTGLIFGFVWFGTAIAAEDEHFCRKGNFILDKCRLNTICYCVKYNQGSLKQNYPLESSLFQNYLFQKNCQLYHNRKTLCRKRYFPHRNLANEN